MSEQIFELKGNLFTLSVLHLFKNDINALVSQLDKKIAQIPKFFVGAPIVVNLQNLSDEKIDFITLRQSLSDLQLNLVGVCNGSEVQNSAAKEQKLSILNYSKDPTPKSKPHSATNTSIVEKEIFVPAQIINGNVRGGQQVYAKNRDLVIMGSVSPGAEVISDGNIHIYGNLRGRAIAGANGQESLIFCQKLSAELVSINGNYWLSDSLQGDAWGNAACISLNNESLKISALV
jgi:septum site-determining protein MinC